MMPSANPAAFIEAVLRQNPVSREKASIADRPGRSVSFEAGLHSLQSALSRRPKVQFSPAASCCEEDGAIGAQMAPVQAARRS